MQNKQEKTFLGLFKKATAETYKNDKYAPLIRLGIEISKKLDICVKYNVFDNDYWNNVKTLITLCDKLCLSPFIEQKVGTTQEKQEKTSKVINLNDFRKQATAL